MVSDLLSELVVRDARTRGVSEGAATARRNLDDRRPLPPTSMPPRPFKKARLSNHTMQVRPQSANLQLLGRAGI